MYYVYLHLLLLTLFFLKITLVHLGFLHHEILDSLLVIDCLRSVFLLSLIDVLFENNNEINGENPKEFTHL